MASTYEKSVKGMFPRYTVCSEWATKVKLAAPKSKYIEHLLMATQVGAVDQVFRPLGFRLKDSTWTIVFKGLIVAHIMIRDGAKDVSLRYLAEQPRYFSTSHISQALVSEQGDNIRDYSRYLQVRVQAWRELKYDYASQRPNGEQSGRLKKLEVEKGLLREVEGVSRLVGTVLKCKFFLGDLSNDITLTAFRLLVSDLLALFQPLNEGVMNVLGHYFEMSRTDAERSLRIYKTFVERTNEVIEYLSEAKALEHVMRLQIPNVKHAPTGLTQALEEYLNDPDFEKNRRQYLEGRGRGKGVGAGTANAGSKSSGTGTTKGAEKIVSQPTRPDPTNPFNSLTGNAQQPVQQQQQQAGSVATAPQNKQQNLIDFFASIESEQTSMFPSPQQQQQQFAPSMPLYSDTAFAQSFQPQQAMPQQFPATTSTNPFPTTNQQFVPGQQQAFSQPASFSPQQQYNSPQQPILRPEWTGAGFGGYTPSSAGSPVTIMPTISSVPSQQFQQPQPQPMQQPMGSGLQVASNSTGTTNPFRASMMVSTQQSTGTSSQGGTNPFSTGQRAQTMSPPLSQAPSFSSQTSYSSLQQTQTHQPQQPQQFQPQFSNPSQPSFHTPQSPVFQQQPQQSVYSPQSTSSSTYQSQPQAAFQVSSTTGTNPFSRPQPQLSQTNRLTPQVTGSNPFRHSILPPSSNNINGFSWTPTQ